MIPIGDEARAVLTGNEQEQLERWKARYSLRFKGWTWAEATRLVFYRWLARTDTINEGWPESFRRSRRPRRLTGLLQIGRHRGRRHLVA